LTDLGGIWFRRSSRRLVIMSFLKICTMKAVLLWKSYTTFCPYFVHSLSDWDKIMDGGYRRSDV